MMCSMGLCLSASAHAGMFDRFLERMVSYRALLCVILLTHIVLYLVLKFCDNNVIRSYKKCIVKVSKRFCKNHLIATISAWILSTIAFGIYLVLVAEQIFFFGGFIILLFWSLYILWVLVKKWRNKYLTGFRAIYKQLNVVIFQIIGTIFYMVICNFEFFKSMFSYTDAEYQLSNFYLYPEISPIFEIMFSISIVGALFILPFCVNWLIVLSVNMWKFIRSK